ncbi:hypothetical protein QA645_13805 [Bradyrhizobium sp. CIAT3101]|uniref:hypothetical protein n=1 Tax=Bradyrhizobium sp. CIAT3101 TaxID=439387 RepID=UPI0024B03ECE|nr:hypothetical protein [Bradyrhizobium sp. CIAT3101]WFU83772.1 hypothetical protein QA645_13805 [Bradyrhizobium sp. CIAT3101]
MQLNRMKWPAPLLMVVASLLLCDGLSLHAEESSKTGSDRWRPKDGTYAEPGSEFDARCGEYGDTQIDWSSNFISGGEEGCKIAKLSDTAPGSIRLDVVCRSADREGQRYKEIILLKKIDEKTIFIRETQDGKFKRPGARMTYCPDELQRQYRENNKKS